MKKILYTFLLISPLLFISSCEKDSDEVASPSIIGLWAGVNMIEIDDEGYVDPVSNLDVITEPYVDTILFDFNEYTLECTSDSIFAYILTSADSLNFDTTSVSYHISNNEIITLDDYSVSDTASIVFLDNDNLELYSTNRDEWIESDGITHFNNHEVQIIYSKIE